MPSQPVRLYQGEDQREGEKNGVIKKMPTHDEETTADCATLLSLHIHTHIYTRETEEEIERGSAFEDGQRDG